MPTLRGDPILVLARGEARAFDCDVVGDPCIVWDHTIDAWRMFYFAQGYHADTRCGTAGMAICRADDVLDPLRWQRAGELVPANRDALIHPHVWHKWWVVQDASRPNHAAQIDGRYWAVFVSMPKHLQVAWAEELGGPWHVLPEPILSPTGGDEPDGRHCDAPTAYWFADRQSALIFYMAYPKAPQPQQPQSPLGSCTMGAWWHPRQSKANRLPEPLLRPTPGTWAAGWIGGLQLWPAGRGWQALINASPSAPSPGSHGEPSPSLGGWATCTATDRADAPWRICGDALLHTDHLTPELRAKGLSDNFWRHYRFRCPAGDFVFFNSGPYGREQLFAARIDEACGC